jgi:hypothetical protein
VLFLFYFVYTFDSGCGPYLASLLQQTDATEKLDALSVMVKERREDVCGRLHFFWMLLLFSCFRHVWMNYDTMQVYCKILSRRWTVRIGWAN